MKVRLEIRQHVRPATITIALFGLAALFTSPAAVRSQTQPAVRPVFDVASVKTNINPRPGTGTGSVRSMPGGRLVASEALLRFIIQNAYGVRPYQIDGGPDWINATHYDIEAKAEGDASPERIWLMTQVLLEDRFKLKVHRETRELPVYVLSVANNGHKLQGPAPGSCVAPDPNRPPLPPSPPGQASTATCGRLVVSISNLSARMMGRMVPISELTRVLSNVMGRTVIDQTGLTGTFDVQVDFTADEALAVLPPRAPGQASPDGTSIFTAMQEQLGLKLDSGKGPVDVLVIDQVEKPTEN